MATPLPTIARNIFFVCALILPLAAFSAAYDYEGEKKKVLNIISFAIGVTAVIIVGILLATYTT